MTDPNGETRATGRCLCEGVSYTVHGELRDVIDCHCWRCRRCRRWTGHHMAATSATTDAVRFDRDDTLRWYELDDGVAYGFCGRCGASVFWRTASRPDRISICAGLLDPPTGLRTTERIYASTASDYHELDANLRSWPLDQH